MYFWQFIKTFFFVKCYVNKICVFRIKSWRNLLIGIILTSTKRNHKVNYCNFVFFVFCRFFALVKIYILSISHKVFGFTDPWVQHEFFWSETHVKFIRICWKVWQSKINIETKWCFIIYVIKLWNKLQKFM